VALHYQRVMQRAAHHGKRAEDLGQSREKIAREALAIKRRATAESSKAASDAQRRLHAAEVELNRRHDAELARQTQLTLAFEQSYTTYMAHQQQLQAARMQRRIARREMKELLEAWRHLATQSILEFNAQQVELTAAQAEERVVEALTEHEVALAAVQGTASERQADVDMRAAQIVSDQVQKAMSAQEEAAKARLELEKVQAAKAAAIEEQAQLRERALETRVRSEIARLTSEHMAEYADVARTLSEQRSAAYEMRSASRPVDLAGVPRSAGAPSRRSPTRTASPPSRPLPAHSESIQMSKVRTR
jgi:hypothetical protein